MIGLGKPWLQKRNGTAFKMERKPGLKESTTISKILGFTPGLGGQNGLERELKNLTRTLDLTGKKGSTLTEGFSKPLKAVRPQKDTLFLQEGLRKYWGGGRYYHLR